MEIQKIFSNIEDPSENLYSVLLSEEELSLFSKLYSKKEEYLNGKETDFQKKSRKALTTSIAGLGATIGATSGIVSATNNPKNFLRAQKISERA